MAQLGYVYGVRDMYNIDVYGRQNASGVVP